LDEFFGTPPIRDFIHVNYLKLHRPHSAAPEQSPHQASTFHQARTITRTKNFHQNPVFAQKY